MRRPTDRTNAGSSGESLGERVVRAMERGSYKTARDLAKELYKQAPEENHWRLLFDATIGRAAQLRRAGQLREAAALLCPLSGRVRTDEQRAALAAQMLRAGDWEAAARVEAAVVDAAVRDRIDRARSDSAVLLHAARIDVRDESRRAGAQRVVAALAAVESGDDTRAGALVTALADTTAFADWRHFVQGLLSFYAGARDIAEWRLLDPQGAPARIAGAVQRSAAAAEGQISITAESSDSLAVHLNDPLDEELSHIQRHCDQEDLHEALRRAGRVARRLPSDLRERLVRALYWEVARSGAPGDVDRLARSMGGPPEDPELSRLYALMAETECSHCAQPKWRAYESVVAKLPAVPPALCGLARSLLWLRMANGADREEPEKDEACDDEERHLSRRECCRQAVAAAPANRAAHDVLIDCLKEERCTGELMTAAREATERFPDHEQALRVLADGAQRAGQPREAIDLAERALRCRPHDESIRSELLAYRRALARQMAVQSRHAEARALLDEPLMSTVLGTDQQARLCLRAAIEYQTGDFSEAEGWLGRACQTPPGRPSALLSVRMEAAALCLPSRITRKLNALYSTALREPAAATAAVAVLRVLAAPQNGLPEEWIRSERKGAVRYVKRAAIESFGAGELREACEYLEELGEKRYAASLAAQGQRRYPEDPAFPLLLGLHFAANEQDAGSLRRARALAERADHLARQSAGHAHLLRRIAGLRAAVNDALAMFALGSVFDLVDRFDFGLGTRRGSAPGRAPRPRGPTPASREGDGRQRSLFDDI